jgi:hypothetical protein
MRLRWTLIVLAACYSLGGCAKKEHVGFVYPDAEDRSIVRYIGMFDSREACQSAARGHLRAMGTVSSGDYTCDEKH